MRIVLLGNAGAGKTTMARQLIGDQDIAHLSLDAIAWGEATERHPSPNQPHCLTREGPDRGIYVRVGSTNRRADLELVEELCRFARGEGFDEQPMPGLDQEAVDFRVASASFARRRCQRRNILARIWPEWIAR